MTATIEYELFGETHSITRDEAHTEKDGYVVAYDEKERGITSKVNIPDHRVVMIHEGDEDEV